MDSAINVSPCRSWTVSALCRSVADTLDARLNPVRVQGEIGSFVQAASGHCYFNLKDAESQLRCAMFRRTAMVLSSMPVNGDKVEVIARVGVHAPRGDLQLVVENLRPAGLGASMEQFLRLKALLQGEGLFDSQRKRPLVRVPHCVGVVTSPDAAALSDVMIALVRRAPHVRVTLAPCAVQGAGAEQSIVQALDSLYACVDAPTASAVHPVPDVILLVRGGGALEDLHAFNDERVARCIAHSPVPVIAGVGHETDFTIADFVADIRAATPTAAAELCAVPVADLERELDDLATKWARASTHCLHDAAQRLDWLAANLSRPDAGLRDLAMQLDHWERRLGSELPLTLVRHTSGLDQLRERLFSATERYIESTRSRLIGDAQRLAAVSPQSVLTRGFSWLEGPKGLVKSVADVGAGDAVRATLVDGVVELMVASTSG